MKNRKTTLLLVLTLLVTAILLAACSSPEPTQAPPPAAPTEAPVDILPTAASGEAMLTAKQNLYVRSGPGQQYPVYLAMSGGETAKLVGVSEDGTFYAIEVPLVSPNTGWVNAELADVTGAEGLPVLPAPPVPPTADFVGPQPGDPTVTALDTVYVRSGPGNEYPAYGIAMSGAKGLLIGESEDGLWWVVRANPEIVGKGHGWVQKEFVSVENVPENLAIIKTPPVPQAGELPPPDTTGPYAVAADYINVRSGPGTNYAVLGVAAPGASSTVTGKSADGLWWQVQISTTYAPDGLGWVNGAYVNAYNVENVPVVEAPAPPPSSTPPEGSYSCILVGQTPVDFTVFSPGEAFQMTWEVQNVGSTTWNTTDTVISKIGAEMDQPLSEVTEMQLNNDVAYGETYEVSVSMTAPSVAGQFGEYWIIMQGDTTVCYFYNVIQVQE
jgi:uncharacterized protein YgiM (DUF1202 family)